jgi:hypothetical protein
MLIPPNDKMLHFNFCNFKCIVASKMQPTIFNNNELNIEPYVYD